MGLGCMLVLFSTLVACYVVVLLSFLFGVWRLAVAMWRGHDRLWGSHHRPSLTVLAILRTNFLYGKIESY